MIKTKKRELSIIGWREWVRMPRLGVQNIKVKVDSGARSSSLHASKLEKFQRDGADWIKFSIHPVQKSKKDEIVAEAKVLEYRFVKSSSGVARLRPVIITPIELLGITWDVELTLASRDNMGFRMLLGREAFRKRFLVDAGRSYYGGRPNKLKKL